MIDILQFCKWFSRMRRKKVFDLADCSWNSTTLLNQYGFFPHKTAQFAVIFHNNINDPGSFLLSPVGPQNCCFTSRPSSNFQAGRIRREITMKKGVALNQIKSNWNLHRNFPFITFIYVLVAETVSDSLLAVLCLVIQSCLTLCDPMDCSLPGSTVHGDSPGKNTGVGCHALLQGIFPTQGSNPGILHCRWIFYHLSHRTPLHNES